MGVIYLEGVGETAGLYLPNVLCIFFQSLICDVVLWAGCGELCYARVHLSLQRPFHFAGARTIVVAAECNGLSGHLQWLRRQTITAAGGHAVSAGTPSFAAVQQRQLP